MKIFNKYDFEKFLKIIKIPIFIDLNKIKEGNYFYSVPIYIINGENKKLKFVDLPVNNNQIKKFINSNLNYLDDLINYEWIDINSLEEIFDYVNI